MVPARTSLALVGTNGSGKSTLLRTLVGLLPAAAARSRCSGPAPGRRPHGSRTASQSHVAAFVLPLRAIEIVRMARFPNRGLLGRLTGEDHDLVRWAMRTMGIGDGAAKEPLRSLSGGQQQRVYLAQVLARRADLIVLDEPTAGLDAGGRERYLEALRRAGPRRGDRDRDPRHRGGSRYDQVLLLARRVVALGPGAEVLTADPLLDTFGILVRDPHEEHRGRFVVAERTHGGPQVLDVGRDEQSQL